MVAKYLLAEDTLEWSEGSLSTSLDDSVYGSALNIQPPSNLTQTDGQAFAPQLDLGGKW